MDHSASSATAFTLVSSTPSGRLTTSSVNVSSATCSFINGEKSARTLRGRKSFSRSKARMEPEHPEESRRFVVECSERGSPSKLRPKPQTVAAPAPQEREPEPKGFVSRYKPNELRKGCDVLVEALEREGVDLVFAYPGGATMEIHQALTRAPSIRNILCRHEQGEIFAAEGYAKCSGRVGVCIATSGPGATNLVTGLADALMDSVPLVAITGQVPRALIGKDAFQETPIIEITRSITKHNHLITSVEEIPRIVREAFHIARTGRPGPVLIDIPKDIQQTLCIPDWNDNMSLEGYTLPRSATRADMEEVALSIRQAKKPVLYVGGGSLDSSDEVKELVARTGIPVAQTLMGLGTFPMTDSLALQMLGMHGTVFANYAIHNCDCLIALGVRFDDRVTGKLEKFARHAKIVHVDIDAAEIDKNKIAQVAVHSDVKPALRILNNILAEEDAKGVEREDISTWVEDIKRVRDEQPLKYSLMADLPSDGSILPQHALQLLWQMTEGKAIITTGVGQHQMWAAQYYPFTAPRNWITSGGLGSMGFGYPAALGCCAARPDAVVIDIDGDGSFQMNIQELCTAYVEKLPVKAVILNNQHLGMVVQWEDRFYSSNRGDTFIGDPTGEGIYPDFIEISKGYRVPAERVYKFEDLPAAYERMLNTPGPYLLDVIVPHQEHVLPMIPGGQSFDEVITDSMFDKMKEGK